MKTIRYWAILSLFAAIVVYAATAHADGPWYVCESPQGDRQVFEYQCPPGWWIVEVLAG